MDWLRLDWILVTVIDVLVLVIALYLTSIADALTLGFRKNLYCEGHFYCSSDCYVSDGYRQIASCVSFYAFIGGAVNCDTLSYKHHASRKIVKHNNVLRRGSTIVCCSNCVLYNVANIRRGGIATIRYLLYIQIRNQLRQNLIIVTVIYLFFDVIVACYLTKVTDALTLSSI